MTTVHPPEELAKLVLSLCPVGSAKAPGDQVQAFYIRMDELRALRELAESALRDHTRAGDALLREARDALEPFARHKPVLIGVTRPESAGTTMAEFNAPSGAQPRFGHWIAAEQSFTSIDAHLSRTPDREPFDRKAVLEEAAKAIAERGWDGSPGYKWANISEAERDEYREDARAALARIDSHLGEMK